MKRVILVALVVLIAAPVLAQIQPDPPGDGPFLFVGVTDATFQGDGTRVAMNRACFAQYPGSRMAFSDEYALVMGSIAVIGGLPTLASTISRT